MFPLRCKTVHHYQYYSILQYTITVFCLTPLTYVFRFFSLELGINCVLVMSVADIRKFFAYEHMSVFIYLMSDMLAITFAL